MVVGTRTGLRVVRDDAWNHRNRSEGPLNRADRNFTELLQELRVLLTGVQILFGFLLTMSFSTRFTEFDAAQHAVFVATLIFAALSSTLLVGPVAAHRVLFQRGRKRELVGYGQRLALGGLLFLALTLASGLLLVLDIAVGRWPALAMAGALLVVTAVVWLGVPLRMRR